MVKIFNLEREYLDNREQLIDIFDRTCRRGEFVMGDEVKAFEADFARYLGLSFSVGVGSGTDAIRMGGLACGLVAGDKVVTTPNTYVATVMALSPHGITPVLCDIEADTYTMDPGRLEEILEKEQGIKLCIPVHLYGHPARMDEINTLCADYGASVFEDACQAHGALYKGRRVGAFGLAAAFSFYPTKNLGCLGDGGGIATDNREVYEKATALRNYGQKTKHAHEIEGFNSRLDELQAAILRYKLTYLDESNRKRRAIAEIYREGLKDTPLVLPKEREWAHHVYHLYVVRSTERDELATYLKEKGVTTLIHYPTPIHLQGAYRSLGYKLGDFPVSEEASRQILSLPMYPGLLKEEVESVCASIKAFYSR
ncbi:MAG TPA: erythromycin biosynthesis sensory transduction protein eryC1 [Deltaproteobacteria bacterium]|jgi:dTDP-4-amino-4,6-dideoxygalactose transaminase|nr:erythromycin biosynthesis sensory transduction protein eryC1 [Deltaproteobacteria bacterium]